MSENNNKKAMDSNKSHWTNERHVHFLNSMEDTFVRTMFESDSRYNPRLDRYLPDTLESTEDLVRERRRRYSTSDIVESSAKKTDKKSKLLSAHISSQDQVVPQFQIWGDNKDKNDKDHLDVPFGRPN
ncbi:uncharacterized protein [Primulina eburnea]|uniref:uncharacterized protein n=1 Tax=Primulina eburnea TaxID=1245227 RepID=UPI003C6C5A33